MSRLKLTVDQVVAAVEALDDAEQAQLRERLLRWFAGLEPLGAGEEPEERFVPYGEDLGFSRRRPRFAAWEDPTITEELELYDALMAFGEE
ncbi:MAG: hypothetical protein LC118_17310 [Dehalococcoidia bacterium]|nr:hypothetical protein [Dehalococcoidia bacterium]